MPQLIERVHWIPLCKLRPKRPQRPRISRALDLSPVHLDRNEKRERERERERKRERERERRERSE